MARSQTNGRGNTPRDEAMLEWMKLHGGLKVVDPEADDIPFPAKQQWEGTTDDDCPWVLPPPGKRCRGTAYIRDIDGDYVIDRDGKRLQRPCWNWPLKGMKVCMSHGGGVTRVRKAAIERMASSLDAATGELVRLALKAKDEKTRLGAITTLMDRVGVRAGIDLNDMKDPAYLDVLKSVFEQTEKK